MANPQTLEIPGYQVIQCLGGGAGSTIWQVKDRQTGKIYAIKRVPIRHASDHRFLEQVINEYQIARQFDHPVIRHVYSMRRFRRLFMLREIRLLMEYCEGKTIQENRPVALSEVVRIFTDVGSAMQAMNAAGFVHGDMKPNNILVSPDGAVKVIDLGQSCPKGTIKRRIQGTPDFIAPEQVHRRPLDARTDVFNFGATLYWTLTGQPIPTVLPKSGNIGLVEDIKVIPVEELNTGIPQGLAELVHDCIEYEPARRPASMKEVVSRLSLIAYKIRSDEKKRQSTGGA